MKTTYFLALALCAALHLAAPAARSATTNAINSGQIIPGSITAPAQTNFYSFTAASDDVLYLTVLRTNGPGNVPFLYLYDPDGIVVTSAADTSDYANISNLRLTKSGTYTLAVLDDTLSESFDYLVTFNFAKCLTNQRETNDGPELLTPGQSGYGHISPADYDTFCFTAASNDVLYLTVLRTNGPGANPYFYLYDPAGTLVTAGNASSILAYAPNLRLTKTGTYTVAVIDNGLSESFNYLITYNLAKCLTNQREPDDGPEAITPGQFSHGHISPADYDTFCFTAASNDVLYLTVLRTNGPGANPYFYLYDPAGTLVTAGNASSILAYAPNLRLTKTGTYTVAVIDNGLSESFNYLITYNLAKCLTNQREPDDGPEAITPGQFSHGHISPADYDTFCFTAASNDVLYLTVLRTNGPGANPYFYLYDPAGTLVTAGNASSILAYAPNLRLTKTGTYTVAVIDNGLSESFNYLITYNLAKCLTNQREPDDGPEAITPGQFSHGHISPADYDTFCFTAASNDVLYLTVLRTNGPGANPYFYLYDPAGTLVTAGNASSILAYAPNLRLTKTGTYTVAVIDNGLSESFDYTLCMIKVPGRNFPEPGEGAELLQPGETRTAQITAGDLDAYSFSVIGGDSVWITLSQISGSGQAYMYVYDPSGNVVDTATSTTHSRIRIPCSTNTGNYTIVVLDSALSRSFNYNLTLLQDPGPPPSYDPAHPYLAIFRCMTNTVVRWPTNAAGFQLQYRDNVVSGIWSNLPPPYPSFVNHYYVTNQSTDPIRFFRLAHP